MAPRRPRPSFPQPDDISTLTLPEVRQRLERNERVLSSGLFASPPPQSPRSRPQGPDSSQSPGNGAPPTSPSAYTSVAVAGPSRQRHSLPLIHHTPSSTRAATTAGGAALASRPTDPVREKLLLARDALLARERELLAGKGMGALRIQDDGESGETGPAQLNGRGSGNARGAYGTGTGEMSGKRRALETIEAQERNFARNGLILPVAQTFALASRDFTAAAADTLSALSLTASSSPKPRKKREPYPDYPPSPASQAGSGKNQVDHDPHQHCDEPPDWDPNDEIARARYLARVNAFMGYKGAGGGSRGAGDTRMEGDLDGDDADGDAVDEMFDFDEDDGHYAGEGGRLEVPGPGRGRRERGTGEEVDEWGGDDEEFAEGNDDYGLVGGG